MIRLATVVTVNAIGIIWHLILNTGTKLVVLKLKIEERQAAGQYQVFGQGHPAVQFNTLRNSTGSITHIKAQGTVEDTNLQVIEFGAEQRRIQLGSTFEKARFHT